MRWYTDNQLAEGSLGDLPPADRRLALEDAGLVYDYVARNPGIGNGKLREWATGAGIPPVRFNAAVGFLREQNRLASVDTPGQYDDEPLVDPVVPLSELVVDELQGLAGRLDVEGRSSMNKDQLIEAIDEVRRDPEPEPTPTPVEEPA